MSSPSRPRAPRGAPEKPQRRVVPWLLGALAASLVAWTVHSCSGGRSRRARPAREADAAPPSAPGATDAGDEASAAVPAPVARPASAAACQSRAERRCFTGDVWWFDGCGEPEQQAQECGLTRCRDAACESPDPLGCDEPPTGRCAGDRVRSCFGGRLRVTDCARLGLHCALGPEGAQCQAEAERQPGRACGGTESFCEDDELVRCIAGREVRVPCASVGGRCVASLTALGAACVGESWSLPAGDTNECGPCGCPDGTYPESCDGKDDDGDGLLDEDVDCGPIDVLAFVVGRPGRYGSYEPADVEAEIERVNQHLSLSASGGAIPPLRVNLLEVVWLDRPAWLELSEDELNELITSPLTHPERPDFYVPLLFTDEVQLGQVPKPGASTLPNGSCGGFVQGRGPEVGLIAVSKSRAPTTVVHELGHFLGLCHTHATDVQPLRVAVDEAGSPVVCDDACRSEGDGMCDTPLDPGAPSCAYDALCHVFCPGPETPDATNLMGYYTDCRARFSAEQQLRMHHTLALRRAWHACAGGACACSLGHADCPAAMGCRRFVGDEQEGVSQHCVLEGPAQPGAACTSGLDCRADSQCIEVEGQGRCLRVCGETQQRCQCEPMRGSGLNVCLEDTR